MCCSYLKNNFAHMGCAFQEAVGLCRLFQREGFIHGQVDFARLNLRLHLSRELSGDFRLEGIESAAQRGARVNQPFEHDGHQVDFKFIPLVEGKLNDAGIRRRGLDVSCKIVAADYVQNHFGPPGFTPADFSKYLPL